MNCKVPEGAGRRQSTQKHCFAIEISNQAAVFHLGTTTRCPPRCLRVAQSARMDAQRVKLPNLGSLEPHNSDTFVSSPLYRFFCPPNLLGSSTCQCYKKSAGVVYLRRTPTRLAVGRKWVEKCFVGSQLSDSRHVRLDKWLTQLLPPERE